MHQGIASESLDAREIGHYSVRNVNKRDETSKKNLHLLRDAQRQIIRLKTTCENDANDIRLLTEKNEILNDNTAEEIKFHSTQKKNAQKAVSYYKTKASKLTDMLNENADEQLKTLRMKLSKYEAKIAELEYSNMHLQDPVNERQISTRN
ncbi:hypothetical protein ACF0H5_012849 [Mactra antiquata]